MLTKPYQKVPIQDCEEPLVPIPSDQFALVVPHPYVALGAPYGVRSPFHLRKGILDRLSQAQAFLQAQQPGWRIQIFDAYRPIAVQQFMVDYSFKQECEAQGLQVDGLSEQQTKEIWQTIYQFWAPPSLNPLMPPPHSTGAAVDVTLMDHQNQTVDMGSAIDEVSDRSHPQYFAAAMDNAGQQFKARRELLFCAMKSAGFLGHPHEWWHFSWGDQLWAWQVTQSMGCEEADVQIAYYGYAA